MAIAAWLRKYIYSWLNCLYKYSYVNVLVLKNHQTCLI